METNYFLKGSIFILGIIFLWLMILLIKKENRNKTIRLISFLPRKIQNYFEFFFNAIIFLIIVIIGSFLLFLEFVFSFFKKHEVLISGEVIKTFPKNKIICTEERGINNPFDTEGLFLCFKLITVDYCVKIRTKKKRTKIINLGLKNKDFYEKLDPEKQVILKCYQNWYFGKLKYIK